MIGEYCARLMDALGLLTPDLIFQAGSGGTSLTSMTALSTKLAQKKISAKMANGGTTCILVDMLKKVFVNQPLVAHLVGARQKINNLPSL